VSWQGLAGTLVEIDRVIQKELGDATRVQPREAAVISQAPEGEAPITSETVPPEKCRLRHGTRHRLDGIPHKLANMPEFFHRAVTLRHAAASLMDPALEKTLTAATLENARLRKVVRSAA
jgi:hypothetical protein